MNNDDFVLLSGFHLNEKLSCIKSTIDLALANLNNYKGIGSCEQNNRNLANGVMFFFDLIKALNNDLVSLRNQKSQDEMMKDVEQSQMSTIEKIYTVIKKAE